MTATSYVDMIFTVPVIIGIIITVLKYVYNILIFNETKYCASCAKNCRV